MLVCGSVTPPWVCTEWRRRTTSCRRQRRRHSRRSTSPDICRHPHAVSGCVASVYDWSWHEAARHFHRALDVNEHHPVAHHWYAINYLVPLRRFDEAAFELRRAADADPFSAPIRASFGIRSYFAHNFPDADRELRDTLHAEAGSAPARLFLGLTLVECEPSPKRSRNWKRQCTWRPVRKCVWSRLCAGAGRPRGRGAYTSGRADRLVARALYLAVTGRASARRPWRN